MVAATRKRPVKAGSSKKATTKNPATVMERVSTPPRAVLKAFHHGADDTENFGFSRFWWEGDGAREGITGKILKKFRPKPGPDDDVAAVTAARADALIPLDAQSDYMDVRHLVERYDATLPMNETHAFVQVTLHFPNAVNMHGPWEEARAFAMDYFVRERRLAAIAVLHAPNLAGSASNLHVHLLIPLRRLGPLGWGEMERHLPNDRGRAEVHTAWIAFRAEWAARWLRPQGQ